MSSGRKPRASNPRRPSARKARARRTAPSPSRRRQYRLRCPFHAKFPDKFRGYNSSCQGTGFETNARVVEHLKRAHGPVELSDDAVTDPEATASPGPPQAVAADRDSERVTNEQFDLIASLPRNPNIQEKWEKIYNIIFPGDEAIKPAYMVSVERLRDHARNPPDSLILKLIGAGMGASHQEIRLFLQNCLLFIDIVGGSPSSLPPSIVTPPQTELGQLSLSSESLVGTSSAGDMKDNTGIGEQFCFPETDCSPGHGFESTHDYTFEMIDFEALRVGQDYTDKEMAEALE
ncbi:hypothetical protein PFICI_02717 [Pestalotiopsis fici W106-1]|uniref:C2H2-type domain-containing protein n=1 Tax=Pestalotiopsis fici (strain W106-1 / CGMCC3.15140) TaxID=1229662 RepID=W3XGX6_PESFW|nr:uncharacterized protein PFICI_02717 [Pestalotiopsis fici W106-1]ETS84692.1 hypothetical protein PFICI_02717 [Pestalotiopsis fici W106-1]